MSSNPQVQDRGTIREEIIKEIKKKEGDEKFQLIALNHILDKKKKKDEELEKQMKDLQREYSKKALEIQTKIQNIVSGEQIKEDFKDYEKYLTEDEANEKKDLGQYLKKGQKLNNYWATCLKNCPMTKNEIEDRDMQVLNELEEIKYEQSDNNSLYNFSLVFYFNQENNEYFMNRELKKEFILRNEDEPIKSMATHIEWKEGKDVTKKTVKKNQKNKKTGAKRQITKEVDDKSFFNFFKPNTIDLEEKGANEKVSEETKGQLEEKMNIDYDIARAIIDEVLPYSLEYYLNVRGQDALMYDDIHKQEEEEKDDYNEDTKKKQNADKNIKQEQDKPECKQQ